jgi:predicted DNA-binding transcriptional regulator YafY
MARIKLVGLALIDYTNWRGERSSRMIEPKSIRYGSNEWHKDEQWLLLAYDRYKGEDREFAMGGIHSWSIPNGDDGK